MSPEEGFLFNFYFFQFIYLKLYLVSDLEKKYSETVPSGGQAVYTILPHLSKSLCGSYTPQGAQGRAVWALPWRPASLANCKVEWVTSV